MSNIVLDISRTVTIDKSILFQIPWSIFIKHFPMRVKCLCRCNRRIQNTPRTPFTFICGSFVLSTNQINGFKFSNYLLSLGGYFRSLIIIQHTPILTMTSDKFPPRHPHNIPMSSKLVRFDRTADRNYNRRMTVCACVYDVSRVQCPCPLSIEIRQWAIIIDFNSCVCVSTRCATVPFH